MRSIENIQNEIIAEFDFFGDWMERYEYIIELGKGLPLIDDQYKDDEHLIKGCQSKVWLHAQEKDGAVLFSADSDAVITKGIIALLMRVLSGQKAEDIAHAELSFIDKIGLREHLSPTRSNGLMKLYGLALSVKK